MIMILLSISLYSQSLEEAAHEKAIDLLKGAAGETKFFYCSFVC